MPSATASTRNQSFGSKLAPASAAAQSAASKSAAVSPAPSQLPPPTAEDIQLVCGVINEFFVNELEEEVHLLLQEKASLLQAEHVDALTKVHQHLLNKILESSARDEKQRKLAYRLLQHLCRGTGDGAADQQPHRRAVLAAIKSCLENLEDLRLDYPFAVSLVICLAFLPALPKLSCQP
jgi:hypothetical protein